MDIITREQWGAGPASNIQPRAFTVYHVIHHTASRYSAWVDEDYRSMRDLQAFHKRPPGEGGRGFRDIGYHFVISPGGLIYEGRKIEDKGSHVLGFNDRSIGIAVVGNFELLTIQPPQWNALVELCRHLQTVYPVAADKIVGHRDLGKTLCPGGWIHYRLPELRQEVKR